MSGKIDRSAARMIDANLNRATEALRVAEDVARFAGNDAFLTQTIKEVRHEIVASVEQVTTIRQRLLARDPLHDVGTCLTVDGEYARPTITHMAVVNLKRAQQAIRALEELAKLQSADAAHRLEQLRYRIYSLESLFVREENRRLQLHEFHLCVLVDGQRPLRAFQDLIAAIAREGRILFQFRDKLLTDRQAMEYATAMMQVTREHGALGVINDRVHIAAAVNADGIHLGQDDLEVSHARRLLPETAIIGVSTHSMEQAKAAVLAGADYLGIGPVYRSRTKSFDHFIAPELVASVIAQTSVPCYAIGGIDLELVPQVVQCGANRIAVGDAIVHAASPALAAREFLRVLKDKTEEE